MDPRAALADLADDRQRGASEIAHDAREHLARLPDTLAPEDAASAARDSVRALLRGHPSMAPIVHLAREALTRLDETGPEGLGELPRHPPLAEQVAERAREELAATGTVITYSRSGTVLATLAALATDGNLRVVTSEARPGQEGLPVARRLAEAGARVELTYDAHLPSLVDRADRVVVGADAITAQALVNKTGTRILLEQAQLADTPTLVLAGTDKLWPSKLPRQPRIPVETGWRPDVPDAVDVRAPLFERVPLAIVDRIVTDAGIQAPDELAAEAERFAVPPTVRDALDRA